MPVPSNRYLALHSPKYSNIKPSLVKQIGMILVSIEMEDQRISDKIKFRRYIRIIEFLISVSVAWIGTAIVVTFF